MKKMLSLLGTIIFVASGSTTVVSCNKIDNNNSSQKAEYNLENLSSISSTDVTVSSETINNVSQLDVEFSLIPFINHSIENASQYTVINKVDYNFNIFSDNKGSNYVNVNLSINTANVYVKIVAVNNSKYLTNSTGYIEVVLSN